MRVISSVDVGDDVVDRGISVCSQEDRFSASLSLCNFSVVYVAKCKVLLYPLN